MGISCGTDIEQIKVVSGGDGEGGCKTTNGARSDWVCRVHKTRKKHSQRIANVTEDRLGSAGFHTRKEQDKAGLDSSAAIWILVVILVVSVHIAHVSNHGYGEPWRRSRGSG